MAGPNPDLRGSNQSGIRAHNERLVLTLIRQSGPLAKADIARLSGLSAQAVSVIMRGLEADGLLEKRAPVRGRVGQPSVPMGLVPEGAYFLGMKVGRRSLDLVLTDFLGTVLNRIHRTHRYPDPDGVLAFANESINRLLAALSAEQNRRVAGLGIAIPFHLWAWAKPLGVEQSVMDAWRNRDIAAEIGARHPFPVYLQNDATSACSAELVFGSVERPPDFLHLFIGFFIGGGVVLNNRLHTGQSGNAGALGPLPIAMPDGRVEQLINVASLAPLERAVIAAGGNADMIWETPKAWTVPEELVERWTEDAANGLAWAIVSACSVIEFTCVVIDGWLPDEVRQTLVSRTRAALDRFDLTGLTRPAVEEGTIGSDARSLGAASLPLSERFLLDRNAFLAR
ncbi:MAG: sugar kinase [Rhodobacterales bacterium CG2_30_65_12]|nr:MAG: sugar kinase [Rhodobacterales bacterium CG2_30_65_12]